MFSQRPVGHVFSFQHLHLYPPWTQKSNLYLLRALTYSPLPGLWSFCHPGFLSEFMVLSLLMEVLRSPASLATASKGLVLLHAKCHKVELSHCGKEIWKCQGLWLPKSPCCQCPVECACWGITWHLFIEHMNTLLPSTSELVMWRSLNRQSPGLSFGVSWGDGEISEGHLSQVSFTFMFVSPVCTCAFIIPRILKLLFPVYAEQSVPLPIVLPSESLACLQSGCCEKWKGRLRYPKLHWREAEL